MPMPTRSPSQTDHGVIWSPLTDVFCDSVADSVAVSIPLGAWTMRCHRPLVIPQGWVQVQVVAAAMPRLKVMRQVPWSSSQRCLILFKSIQSMCFLLCLLDKRWRLSSTSKDNLRQSKTTVLVCLCWFVRLDLDTLTDGTSSLALFQSSPKLEFPRVSNTSPQTNRHHVIGRCLSGGKNLQSLWCRTPFRVMYQFVLRRSVLPGGATFSKYWRHTSDVSRSVKASRTEIGKTLRHFVQYNLQSFQTSHLGGDQELEAQGHHQSHPKDSRLWRSVRNHVDVPPVPRPWFWDVLWISRPSKKHKIPQQVCY